MSTVVGASFAFTLQDLETSTHQIAGSPLDEGGAIAPAARRFLTQLHDDAVAEDLDGLSVDDVAALSARFWAWAARRPRGQMLARIEPGLTADGSPLGRDVLEIVTLDKPFLVDSVMGEINDQGVDVLAMFHPIVTVERDEEGNRVVGGAPVCESMIQVHLEPMDEFARARLLAEVRTTLNDVDAAVADLPEMRARMDHAIDELKSAPTSASRDELDEVVAFLRWLRDDNFAFLGARVYEFATDASGKLIRDEPIILDETGRGILRDPQRHVLRRGSEPAIVTPAIHEFLCEPTPIIVAKSNLRSRVHRRIYMDYIGVKRYRADGQVVGETRFVGLFTSRAYNKPVQQVPLIRRKVQRVAERADRTPESHNFKKLQYILETYPRDELFQADEDELLKISLGILHLQDRPRAKLFVRADRFSRYVSAFVFVPRERYDSKLRIQIGELLADAYGGHVSAFYPSFADGPLARVHFIIGMNPLDHKKPDIAAVERDLVELARTWDDEFVRLARRDAPASLKPLIRLYEGAFSAGYREATPPDEALKDVSAIEAIDADGGMGVRAFRLPGDDEDQLRVKLFRQGADPVALSDSMMTMEAMGLRVLAESGYPIRRHDADGAAPDGGSTIWVHDFDTRFVNGVLDIPRVAPALERSAPALWSGRSETDGFNRLIISLGAHWREVALLRACSKYRLQSGQETSQQTQEQALAEHPKLTALLLQLARVRFDPSFPGDMAARRGAQDEINAEITAGLDEVARLDHDRVLRRIWNVLLCVVRTNFHQRTLDGEPRPAIALKIASRELAELPLPKPDREVFVWSPRVEGVHLRFGPVARGGLRWSDRRDDFRTEVLGLVKAQVVKNAVIVPVGAKGGFFPKHLPRGGTREEIQAEGIAAYKEFISALLDVTDNLVDGEVVPPTDVVRWDEDDPYFVVAADKGTAAFSDIANSIAVERRFWLGDAFASGGSAGYDHKKMGITARGGWEAVKRHFREMGKDIQNEPFTVAGVGDMSGDVFGNGMLLSRKIQLLAAFDHRDIFLDPNPTDLEACWAERQRLFQLPRSSWQDYNTELISAGGGIFSRSSKSIPLNPTLRELLDLEGESVTPSELMRAIMAMNVELMWFGGIGTYIKSSEEQNWEVGDRANDALRVDAEAVKAKVIGEGANLGVTQAGRVALCRHGVRVNADFIDNAGGVASSDHEVNIKILLNPIVRSGRMTQAQRDELLESMTDNVADLVLTGVYDQTLAITIAESDAVADRDAYERLIERLEGRGQIVREVEGLPTAEEFRELKEQGLGLTRPEIALLISHAKISLFSRIMDSSVPDDPHMQHALQRYFPEALAPLVQDMAEHSLRREIIATCLVNDLVNIGGATFVHRARESTGANTDAVARGFEAARSIFGFMALRDSINALDNVAPASVQIELHKEIITLLRRQTYWLVRRGLAGDGQEPRPLADVIADYKPGVEELRSFGLDLISPFERGRVLARAEALIAAGAPEALARDVAGLRPMLSSSDIIDLAKRSGRPLALVARIYHQVGDRFEFDRLRAAAASLSSPEHFDRLAVRRLIEDLYAEHQRIAELILANGDDAPAEGEGEADWARDRVERWSSARSFDVSRMDETMSELRTSGGWTMSKLAIAVAAMREFTSAAAA